MLTRHRTLLVLLPLTITLIIWTFTLAETTTIYGGPSGAGFGSDFAMMYAGSDLLAHQGNPYHHPNIVHRQAALMHAQHLAASKKRSLERVGNPPLMIWALEPLARLPFRTAFWIWFFLQAVLSVAGFVVCAVSLGWKRWFLPLIVFLVLPQTALQLFYGNVTSTVFAAFACAFLLATRRPALAGLLLTVGWLKPTVSLPIAMVIIIFHSTDWKRMAGGLAVGSVLFWLLNLLLVGRTSIGNWMAGLSEYKRDIRSQPEIATMAGAWVRWVRSDVAEVLSVLCFVAAVALTLFVLTRLPRKRPIDPVLVAPIWFVWFLASPYAHIQDIALLTIPIMAMMGPDGRLAGRAAPAAILYLLFLCLVVNRVGDIPVDLEPFKLLVIALLMIPASLAALRARKPQGTVSPVSGQPA